MASRMTPGRQHACRRTVLALTALLWLSAARGQMQTLPPDPDCQPEALREAAQTLASALRAQAQQCGSTLMRPAAGLRWNERLAASAQAFAHELAERKVLSHEGRAAPTLRDRLRQTGYRMRMSGENLAAGPDQLNEVFDLWLHSPAHCSNLMQADFEEMGLACAPSKSPYGRFWVLHLGAPMGNFQLPRQAQSGLTGQGR